MICTLIAIARNLNGLNRPSSWRRDNEPSLPDIAGGIIALLLAAAEPVEMPSAQKQGGSQDCIGMGEAFITHTYVSPDGEFRDTGTLPGIQTTQGYKQPVGAYMDSQNSDSMSRGMHHTYLVRDVDKFIADAQIDRVIPFGINNEEWHALWFDVLGVDSDEYSNWAQDDDADDFVIAGYPMISRITNNYMDASFEGEQIEHLRQECLRINSNTRNELALRGTDKLLRICDMAQKLGLSIYLMSD
jgi:hypothetical protein